MPNTPLRNSATGDQVAEMIPWSTLAWVQVHQGHLPLWNPYSGLGLPLAFNWQSAAFSLPMAVSYLFPLHLAYTVQIVLTLVIAGTGAYVLARVLHVGIIGCAAAGTVFELVGSFMGWLGYPHAAVMSWGDGCWRRQSSSSVAAPHATSPASPWCWPWPCTPASPKSSHGGRVHRSGRCDHGRPEHVEGGRSDTRPSSAPGSGPGGGSRNGARRSSGPPRPLQVLSRSTRTAEPWSPTPRWERPFPPMT